MKNEENKGKVNEKELNSSAILPDELKTISGGQNEDKKCPLGLTWKQMSRFNRNCKNNVCGCVKGHTGPYVYCGFFDDLN